MKQNETKNMQIQLSNYICNDCDYICSKKSLWKQHISTQKHILKQNETKNMLSNKEKHIFSSNNVMQNDNECIFCDRVFNSRTSLWRHKKQCKKSETIEEQLK